MTPRICDFPGCHRDAFLWNDHKEWSCGRHQDWLARKRAGRLYWDKDRAVMVA